MAIHTQAFKDRHAAQDWRLIQAFDEIESSYGEIVSIRAKRKSIRKWGSRTTVGTGIETLETAQGSETSETFVSTNAITTVVSTSASDTQVLQLYEGQTISGGNASFALENDGITLTGNTPVTLPTALFRATRARLASPAVGTIAFYEGGTRTDANTHLTVPPGDIQSQKASTTISSVDYWIITGATGSVLEKTSSWAAFRIEIKPITASNYYPITQWVGVSDASGTRSILDTGDPYLIVPTNHDVRLAVTANTANVDVAGGMIGVLAKVIG